LNVWEDSWTNRSCAFYAKNAYKLLKTFVCLSLSYPCLHIAEYRSVPWSVHFISGTYTQMQSTCNLLTRHVNYVTLQRSTCCHIWWENAPITCGRTYFQKMPVEHMSLQNCSKSLCLWISACK